MAIQLLLFIVWFGWKGGVDWPNFQNGGREAEGSVNVPPWLYGESMESFLAAAPPLPLATAPVSSGRQERAGSQGPTSVAAFLAFSSAF